MLELRDLATGSDGKGPVGGAIEGLEGRGSELPDMLTARSRKAQLRRRPLRALEMRCRPERVSFFSLAGPYAAAYMSVAPRPSSAKHWRCMRRGRKRSGGGQQRLVPAALAAMVSDRARPGGGGRCVSRRMVAEVPRFATPGRSVRWRARRVDGSVGQVEGE